MSTSAKNLFDFFGLPRELRDWCYQYMIADDLDILPTEEDCGSALLECYYHELTLRSGPRMELLIISHQFAAEYVEAIQKHMTFQTKYSSEPMGSMPTLPAMIQHVPVTTIQLHTLDFRSCGDQLPETIGAATWLESFLDDGYAKCAVLEVGILGDERWQGQTLEESMPELRETVQQFVDIIRNEAKLLLRTARAPQRFIASYTVKNGWEYGDWMPCGEALNK